MKKITETTYFYKESESSDDVVLDRTITKETVDGCDCDACENGELITGEAEVVDRGSELATAALTLASVSLCIVTIASIFRRN